MTTQTITTVSGLNGTGGRGAANDLTGAIAVDTVLLVRLWTTTLIICTKTQIKKHLKVVTRPQRVSMILCYVQIVVRPYLRMKFLRNGHFMTIMNLDFTLWYARNKKIIENKKIPLTSFTTFVTITRLHGSGSHHPNG